MTRQPAIAAAVATLLALTACAVSAEDTPRPIEPPPGPYLTTVSPPPSTSTAGTVDEVLCLVREAMLVRVVRKVAEPPSIDAQLRHLSAGPTPQERDAGLTSALTGRSHTATADIANGNARIEVRGDESTGRSDEVLAFGQIVCTLTARQDVTTVSFLRDGRPLSVPRADGSLSDGPLTTGDYASLIAPS